MTIQSRHFRPVAVAVVITAVSLGTISLLQSHSRRLSTVHAYAGGWADPQRWRPTNHTTRTVSAEITPDDWRGRRPRQGLDQYYYTPTACTGLPLPYYWPNSFHLYDAYEFAVDNGSDPNDPLTYWRFSTDPDMTDGVAHVDFNDVIALYRNCYEPEDPCRNLVSYCNWDPVYGGISSYLIQPLAVGHYVLLVTAQSTSDDGHWFGGHYTMVINAPLGESVNLTTPASETDFRCPATLTSCEGLLSCTDYSFDRPAADGSCPDHQATFAYESYAFPVNATGWWSFSTCGDTGLLDPMMVLYTNTIACHHIIALNDDFCGRRSRISLELTPGFYELVVTSYVPREQPDGDGYGYYTLDVRPPSVRRLRANDPGGGACPS